MPDPTMPKTMPPTVDRELTNILGYRNRPNPIDLYCAIKRHAGFR